MATRTKLQILLNMPIEAALTCLREALLSKGFGVLTEIDVQATLQAKLNEDFYPYRILGVCNPAFAYRLLEVDPSLGVFLPCTIAIYDTGTGTKVQIQDPNQAVEADSPPELAKLAKQVRKLLTEVVGAMNAKNRVKP